MIEMKNKEKIFFYSTWFLCFISGFASVPLVQTMAILSGGKSRPNILELIIFEGFLYGLIIFFGMKLVHKIGTRFLFLSDNVNWKQDLFKPAIYYGITAALTMLLIDLILPKAPMTLWFLLTHIPLSQGLLAAIFCIVNQEVFLCMLCISGIVLLLKKIFPHITMNILMPIGIVLSALYFGAGHIPQFLHSITPEAPLLIIRIMVINLISGITFGMLFWKKSFETAVLAHFVVDFILYAGIPAICLLF